MPPPQQKRKSSMGQWLVLVAIIAVFALLWFFAFQMRPKQHKLVPVTHPANSKSHFLDAAEGTHSAVTKALQLAEEAMDRHKARLQATKVAAILVFSDYNPSLRIIVTQLHELDFVKEIVLWQDGGQSQSELQAVVSISPKVVYHVGQMKLKKLAKYFACAHAVTQSNACFYQGLNFNTIDYAELLFASYLRAPQRMHVAADPITLYHDSELCFYDEASNLHAGLAYPEYGAIWSLQAAKHFLEDHLTDSALQKLAVQDHADSRFSVSMNQPPLLLSVHVRKLPQQIGMAKLIHLNSYQRRQRPESLEAAEEAFSHLIPDLLNHRPGVNIDPVVWLPATAAASQSRSLFVTNEICTGTCSPTASVPETISRLEKLVRVWCDPKSEGTPTACVPKPAQLFAFMSYHHAVDSDPRTLWMSVNNATDGSFFGLDLLEPRSDLHNVSVVYAHPFQDELVLEISAEGGEWFEVVGTPPVVQNLGEFVHLPLVSATYALDTLLSDTWARITQQPQSQQQQQQQQQGGSDSAHGSSKTMPPLYIRYVRFRCMRDMGAPFIVSEIAFDHTERQNMDHIGRVIDVAEENTWANAVQE